MTAIGNGSTVNHLKKCSTTSHVHQNELTKGQWGWGILTVPFSHWLNPQCTGVLRKIPMVTTFPIFKGKQVILGICHVVQALLAWANFMISMLDNTSLFSMTYLWEAEFSLIQTEKQYEQKKGQL